MLLSLNGEQGGQADVDFDLEDADLDNPAVVAELVKALKDAREDVKEQEEG